MKAFKIIKSGALALSASLRPLRGSDNTVYAVRRLCRLTQIASLRSTTSQTPKTLGDIAKGDDKNG